MGENQKIQSKNFFTRHLEEFKKSGRDIIPTLVEWDAQPYNLKFNFRKRLISFYFDLIVVLMALGMVTFWFYK